MGMSFLDHFKHEEGETLRQNGHPLPPITDENIGYVLDEVAKLWLDSSGSLRMTVTWRESDVLEYIVERVKSGSIRERNSNSAYSTLFLSGNKCVPYTVEVFGPFMKNTYKLEKWKKIINAGN
jgi:hypothetical protein